MSSLSTFIFYKYHFIRKKHYFIVYKNHSNFLNIIVKNDQCSSEKICVKNKIKLKKNQFYFVVAFGK